MIHHQGGRTMRLGYEVANWRCWALWWSVHWQIWSLPIRFNGSYDLWYIMTHPGSIAVVLTLWRYSAPVECSPPSMTTSLEPRTDTSIPTNCIKQGSRLCCPSWISSLQRIIMDTRSLVGKDSRSRTSMSTAFLLLIPLVSSASLLSRPSSSTRGPLRSVQG